MNFCASLVHRPKLPLLKQYSNLIFRDLNFIPNYNVWKSSRFIQLSSSNSTSGIHNTDPSSSLTQHAGSSNEIPMSALIALDGWCRIIVNKYFNFK